MSAFGDSCPDEFEARSEGRRAFERGYSNYGNPYVDECDEAADAWRSGYNGAQQRAEEERRAEAAAQRRQQEVFEEQAWEQMQEEAYYQQRDGYR